MSLQRWLLPLLAVMEVATPNCGAAGVVGTGSIGLAGLALGTLLSCALAVRAQNPKPPAAKSRSFDVAIEELRSKLEKKSISAEDIPGPAAGVFKRITGEVARNSPGTAMFWELRATEGLDGNAFSLPDGAVYVDKEMMQILGNDPGLWAAVLAHEIAHVTARHWAKRAGFQTSLNDFSGNLGFTQMGVFPASRTSSTSGDRERELATFSEDLELEADIASLGLMARSGFHPDFVIALYHLMEAREGTWSDARFSASHPGWGARERGLRKGYAAAVDKFERFWPEASQSPGGNPPMLAFVGPPQARIDSSRAVAEVTLPLRCENSTSQVEVILLLSRLAADLSKSYLASKMKQTVECTTDKRTAKFVVLADRPKDEVNTEFYVMDSRGWVLARSSKLSIHY